MVDKDSEKKMNRRNFIKTTAAGAGMLALSGFLPETAEAKAKMKWDQTCDVIIIGAGGAGLMAAIEAARAKSKVILLESMPLVGGSSAICGGGLVFAGTDMQKAEGVSDSNDLLYKDIVEIGKNRNVPEMVKTYVDNQLETYNKLKQLGVKFLVLAKSEGSVKRMHQVKPAELISILKKEADRLGVKTILQTRASGLFRNDSGRIIGVKANRAKKEISIRAKKAVVVTAGGFSNNPEMLEDYHIGFSKVTAITGPGSRGDGLKMLSKEGAWLKDLPSIKATFSANVKSTTGKLAIGTMNRQGAIIVNKLGKRFVNEAMGHKEIPDYVLPQPGSIGFLVFDGKIAPEAAKVRTQTLAELEQWCIKAGTLEELATKAKMPPAELKDTVTKYNSYVDTGKDLEFGREGLIGKGGKLIKIDTPPFYIFEGVPVILGTYCGALVDSRSQVVDVYGNKIPGLYAAGEVTGGFHGDGYIGGTAFGKALIFGMVAGRSVAAEKTLKS